MSFFRRANPAPAPPEPHPLAQPYQKKSQPRPSYGPPPPASTSRADPASGVPPKAGPPPPPPPRSNLTPQQQRLATLARLSAQLEALTATVRVPGRMSFAAGSTASAPQLTFDAVNKAALELDDALTKMLIALDGVESEGDETVRDERKKLVKRVEAEIEQLEAAKREQCAAQLAAGEIPEAAPSEGEHDGVEAKKDAFEDTLGKLNGRLPPRGGVPTPPPGGPPARIYQHVGPEHGWNDAPPAFVRRAGGAAETDSPPAPRNKRASMRRPPPTQFY